MTTLVILVLVIMVVLLALSLGFSGRRLTAKENLPQSKQELSELVEREPENNEARWLLAQMERRSGNTDAARALTVSLADSVPEITFFHAECLRDLGHLKEAEEFLKSRQAGATPALILLYAQMAEKCGHIIDAIAAYRSLETLAPNERFHLARLLARIEKFDESVEHFQLAQAALPEDPSIAREFSAVLNKVGRHHDAWELLHKLYNRAANPDRIALAQEYVNTLQNVGNVNGALTVLDQVAQMPEATPGIAADMKCTAGEILLKMNNPEEARLRWQEALERLPSHARALQLLQVSERPTDPKKLVAYIGGLSMENFRKLFEKILSDWSYTLNDVREVDKDSLRFSITRFENGKDVRKLVFVKRWENNVGMYPIQDLKKAMMEKAYDGGIFMTATQFDTKALVFAGQQGNIELFSANEIFPLIEMHESRNSND